MKKEYHPKKMKMSKEWRWGGSINKCFYLLYIINFLVYSINDEETVRGGCMPYIDKGVRGSR